jgi:hypothetical protein
MPCFCATVARVQDRSVFMRCGDLVVATARASVAADSPALTPAIRKEIHAGAGLGDLLRPLHRRRVAVRVTGLRERPAGDPTAPVLAVQARLDVGGTPIAWCEETVYDAVFVQDLNTELLAYCCGDGDLARRVELSNDRQSLSIDHFRETRVIISYRKTGELYFYTWQAVLLHTGIWPATAIRALAAG